MPWLYKQKRSKFWWLGWRANGRSYFKSTKKTVREEAEVELRKVEMLISSSQAGLLESVYASLGGAPTTGVRRSLKLCMTEWLSDCRRRKLGKSTLVRCDILAKRFLEFTNAGDAMPVLTSIGVEIARNFLLSRSEQVSIGTVMLDQQTLHTFFGYCEQNEWVTRNPAEFVDLGKLTSEKRQNARIPFTPEQLNKLLEVAPSPFWQFIVLAGFYTGQAPVELILLKWEQVDLPEGVIHWTRKKTQVPVKSPIRKELLQFLLKLREKESKTSGYLWPAQAELYHNRGAKAFSAIFRKKMLVPSGLAEKETRANPKQGRTGRRSVNPLTLYSLRHSFITYVKVGGADQSSAKALAGHLSDAMSDHYTKLPVEALRKYVDALPALTLPTKETRP